MQFTFDNTNKMALQRLGNIVLLNNKLFGSLENPNKVANIFVENFLYIQEILANRTTNEDTIYKPSTSIFDKINEVSDDKNNTIKTVKENFDNDEKVKKISINGHIKKLHSFSIHNRSNKKKKSVIVEVNNKNFSTISSILRFILGDPDKYSDKEKAFIIFRFLKNYRVATSTSGYKNQFIYLYPPMALSTNSGGDCVWTSLIFARLCSFAGVRVKVYYFAGVHAFPEVFFDGEWHILDPDGETFYPIPSKDYKLAGVNYIKQNSNDIPLDSLYFADQLESARKSFISTLTGNVTAEIFFGKNLEDLCKPYLNYDLSFDLIPGERITFFYDFPWYWISIREFEVPRKQRSIFVDQFDISSMVACGNAKINGIEIIGSSEPDSSKMMVAGNGSTISFSIKHRYFLIDGFIRITGDGLLNKKDVLLKYRCNNSQNYSHLSAVIAKSGFICFRLRRIFFYVFEAELISIDDIVLTFKRRVNNMRIQVELIGEISPFSLPEFSEGVNTVNIYESGVTSNQNDIEVETSYYPMLAAHISNKLDCVYPENDAQIDIDSLDRIAWDNGLEKSVNSKRYQIIVSLDYDLIVPIAPNFYRIIEGSELRINSAAKAFLQPGRKYFWQVREINDNGFVSEPVSDVYSFTLL